jgi:uncharacterized phage-like protein YoqJ
VIVSVTGHRPPKVGGYGNNSLRSCITDNLKDALVEANATLGISGMAIGVDQWFAQACLDLSIPFLAAVPFVGQESRWPTPAQIRYRQLLAKAAEIVHVCDPGYARWKMQARNEWMVDRCDRLIAVWDGSAGGTANTVLYANKVQRTVHLINPRELESECQTAVKNQ